MSAKDQAHNRFVESLLSEERLLIQLRDDLFGGSFERMRDDLRARLCGRPHIVRLERNILTDLAAVERFIEYEDAARINLAEYLAPEPTAPLAAESQAAN